MEGCILATQAGITVKGGAMNKYGVASNYPFQSRRARANAILVRAGLAGRREVVF
jgi:endonuclease YncB( thermonuclease family)